MRQEASDRVVALAGNPNGGKSTVFNELTGLNQHTGNWPGKTVTNAQGTCRYRDKNYILVDIPGTYSLMAHSAEEEVARDFICFGEPDAVVVVCDATCLERNLNLVLQTIEITENVVVCVNLMDEAKKKKITIDLKGLSKELGVPVVGAAARSGKGLDEMMRALETLPQRGNGRKAITVQYIKPIEEAIDLALPAIEEKVAGKINARWLALKLLDYDETLVLALGEYLGYDLMAEEEVKAGIQAGLDHLEEAGITREQLRDKIVASLVLTAEGVCAETVTFHKETYNARDRRIDRILTSKWTGFPIMIAMLAVIFWI
ncbi:FeoB small GTPase domain-containing protein, partial [Akkermansia muciniphila]|uniref:FeoB small GTPase domain-containing protein n=1 Tax=Akkermansia muciniphila TaxID=239935 RepID=UPI0034E07934